MDHLGRARKTTSIEWTDRTWNPVRGCSRVSEGCRHCYAETLAARFSLPGNTFHGFAERTPAGPRWTGEVALLRDRLAEPLAWKQPSRVFVNSMSDLFHESLPDTAIDQVFAAMALAPQHTFQILTKRVGRMRSYLTAEGRHAAIVAAMDMPSWMPARRRFPRVPENWPLSNVWLGPSIENRMAANEHFPLASDLGEQGWHVMVSMEPLLEHVFVSARFLRLGPQAWVIVGGESGPGARPFDICWARAIVAQCQSAHVPVFIKQLGTHIHTRNDDGWEGNDTPRSWPMDTAFDEDLDGFRDGYQGAPVRVRLNDRKGSDMAEWPLGLRVREFPA